MAINSRALAQSWLTAALGIEFPFVSMGKIDSLNLFDPNELVLFEFYRRNPRRYSRALDIGANLGLHSILMAKNTWMVNAYEPDPDTYKLMRRNLQANVYAYGCVETFNAAVHTSHGEMAFIRVQDNLTASHLQGYKDSYGPTDTFMVQTVDCRQLFDWADFAKIDCEGNEADILLTTTPGQMKHLDCMVEVRDEKNAVAIYRHFRDMGVPMYAQCLGWDRIAWGGNMPADRREGSLFIAGQGKPPFIGG